MPDPNDPVEEMYDLLAGELLAMLRSPACEHCGTHALSAAHLNLIRQFLSDNEMKRVGRARPNPGGNLPRIVPPFPREGNDDVPVQNVG